MASRDGVAANWSEPVERASACGRPRLGHAAPATASRFDAATADLDPPFAIVDDDAFDANAAALAARAGGKPIRVASKSVRCRELLRDVLGPARLARRDGVHPARGDLAGPRPASPTTS